MIERRQFLSRVTGTACAATLSAALLRCNRALAADGLPGGEEADDERSIGGMVKRAEPIVLPPVVFQDADGRDVTLEKWRGAPVVLHLWATWCGPCRLELPQVDRTVGELGASGVRILPVATHCGGTDKVKAFYAAHGVAHLPVYTDPKGAFVNATPPGALPETLILDAQGRGVARHFGNMQWSAAEVRKVVQALTGAAI